MIENDAPNPYLTNKDIAEALDTGIHSLVACAALTVDRDPGLTTAFVTSALSNLASFADTSDASSAVHALLFEVARYIHNHVDASVPVIEAERPESHEEAFKRDPRLRLIVTASTEWFRLTCGQKDEAAANVLKAIHKEIPLPMLPQAMLHVATVSLCSLSASVAYQVLGGDDDGEHSHA